MSISQKKQRIIDLLINIANKGDMIHKLAAALVNGSKIVGKPSCNSNRVYCRGKLCPSIHAEAGAILNFYGKALRWYGSSGWVVLRDKGEQAKVAKVGYICN